MIKRILVIYKLLLLPIMVQAQYDTIHWCTNKVITWSDYHGSPSRLGYNNNNVAATNSGIRIDLKSAGPLYWNLNIVAVFNSSLSSTKTDTSLYLLNHERNHFNISEIVARLLRRDLMNTTLPPKDAARAITQIYNKHIAELEKLQDAYDNDTQHSMNRDKQASWDKWVAEQLSALSAYSNTAIKLRTH